MYPFITIIRRVRVNFVLYVFAVEKKSRTVHLRWKSEAFSEICAWRHELLAKNSQATIQQPLITTLIVDGWESFEIHAMLATQNHINIRKLNLGLMTGNHVSDNWSVPCGQHRHKNILMQWTIRKCERFHWLAWQIRLYFAEQHDRKIRYIYRWFFCG